MVWKHIVCAVLAGAAAMAAGCSSLPREKAVPRDEQSSAVVAGLTPGVRTWGGVVNPAFREVLSTSIQRERAVLGAAGQGSTLPPANFLAISGGGSDGAFGAGLICAWTERGDRPEFKVVTGISTGALTAPFVFAGPEYDHVLREVYTKTKTADILNERSILEGFMSDAMADTKPLRELVAKLVDEKLMDKIAAESRKGRLLIIGTTNIDARRAVLWNVGEIAEVGGPKSLEVIRKIMIASSAIPGAFPPVLIDVEVDGKKYQEMHVDGGAMTQVFLYPPSMNIQKEAEAQGFTRDRHAYVIRNSRLDPDWAEVERSTMSIVQRAITSLIQTQGIGDLYRIYLTCQRDNVDFNLAFIPPDFKVETKEPFDPVYMSALFQRGYEMMKAGYPWEKTPIGYDKPVVVE